jgi:hypothetical protein
MTPANHPARADGGQEEFVIELRAGFLLAAQLSGIVRP